MDIILLGAGGHAKDTIKNIREYNLDCRKAARLNIVCCLDDMNPRPGDGLLGHPVSGDLSVLQSRARRNARVLCAVGDPLNRKRFVAKAARYKPEYLTFVHPSVKLDASIRIGRGSSVFASAVLSAFVTLGEHVSCNYQCSVSHDSVLADFVTLCPGVNVSGRAAVGEGTLMGVNACCANNLSIGAWSVIGAGAIVSKSVPARSVLAACRPVSLGKRDMSRAFL